MTEHITEHIIVGSSSSSPPDPDGGGSGGDRLEDTEGWESLLDASQCSQSSSQPGNSLRARNWCFTVASHELDDVWQGLLEEALQSGHIVGYEYALEVGTSGRVPYPHYHGTVFLADVQRGLTWFRSIFRGLLKAHVKVLDRRRHGEFMWRRYYRKTLGSPTVDLNSDSVARFYREDATLSHLVPDGARPARSSGHLSSMIKLGTAALKDARSKGGSQRSAPENADLRLREVPNNGDDIALSELDLSSVVEPVSEGESIAAATPLHRTSTPRKRTFPAPTATSSAAAAATTSGQPQQRDKPKESSRDQLLREAMEVSSSMRECRNFLKPRHLGALNATYTTHRSMLMEHFTGKISRFPRVVVSFVRQLSSSADVRQCCSRSPLEKIFPRGWIALKIDIRAPEVFVQVLIKFQRRLPSGNLPSAD